jgi:predicted RNA binding protein YcfA (HicA-like mRNA interferase family)
VTKRDKLVALVQARPATASYRDVEKLLTEFGWTLRGVKGSHHSWKKPGEHTLTITVHDRNVVREALTDICDRLGLTD